MSRDFDTVRIAQKALSDIKMNTITMKDYQEMVGLRLGNLQTMDMLTLFISHRVVHMIKL